MKKILSILFAVVLVLSFSLVTAVPVAASDTPNPTFATLDMTDPTSPTTPSTEISIGWERDPVTGAFSGDDVIHVTTSVTTSDIAMVIVPTAFTLDINTTISYWGYTVGGDVKALDEIYLFLDNTGDGAPDVTLLSHQKGPLPPLFGQWDEWTLGDENNEWHTLPDYEEVLDIATYTEGSYTVVAIALTIGPPGGSTGVNVDVYFDQLTVDGVALLDNDTGFIDVPLPLTGFPAPSIQDAIDAALPSTTIIVAAGTYPENITIDRTLTLEGAQAGENARGRTGPESIINPQSLGICDGDTGNDFGVLIYGADTIATFDGFTVENYHRVGILAGSFTLAEEDPSVVHILNNIVSEPIGQHNNNCIQIGHGTTGTIIGNEVFGAFLETPDYSGSGILVAGSSDVLVSNNYVHDCEGGIQIMGTPTVPAENNLIENNLAEGNESGIVAQQNSIDTIIRYNDALNNDIGIESVGWIGWPDYLPSGTEIHFNNIVGNADYGVKSSVWDEEAEAADGEQVDATNNWWDSASGPGGEGRGSGDTVSANVVYEPWLLTEGALTDVNLRYDKTVALNSGWTIVSPGAELESWVAVDAEDLVLAYDAVAGAFVEATNLGPITPMFIKTEASGGIGFNYADDSQGMFTTNLEAGWNLIGIPETVADVDAILSPIRLGVNNEVALATLASQGNYNPSGETFYESMLNISEGVPGEVVLHPNDGYWAYMNVAKEFGVVVVE
ncbi:hypothetical protein ES707_00135 [subsurface metagenome]